MVKWFPVRIPWVVIVRAFEFFTIVGIDAFEQVLFHELPEIMYEFSSQRGMVQRQIGAPGRADFGFGFGV
jgi:hypothetical protein